MSHSSIWVLIAGDNEAAVWTSQAGTSKLLQLIRRKPDPDPDRCGAFASQLMSELSAAATSKACDGIIMMAEEGMLGALRRATSAEVKRLLVGEIFATPATIAAIPKEAVSQTEWGVAA
jgi:protein required for attachment to host cells